MKPMTDAHMATFDPRWPPMKRGKCSDRMPHNGHYVGTDLYCTGRAPVYPNGTPPATRTMRLLGRG